MKKASAPPAEQQGRRTGSTAAAPVFIDNISFRPGAEDQRSSSNTTSSPGSLTSINETVTIKQPASKVVYTENNTSTTAAGIEALSALKFKYGILLDAPVEDLTDAKLLEFIDDWYGTRYRLGGNDKSGIDCSAFVQSFLATMYGMSVSRTCKEQYHDSRRIKKSHLKEGDLVFFKIRGKSVSHVGVYLRNNKFIHASTSGGVMISDLADDYFEKRYAGAGRF